MKKHVVLLMAVILLLVSVGTALAGGGPNGAWVRFSGCDSWWKATPSGLVHEWRNDTSCMFQGYAGLYLVFKPIDKFATPDCDDEGYLASISNWKFTYQYNETYTGDEADLGDFLTPYAPYHVCFYNWDYAELPTE